MSSIKKNILYVLSSQVIGLLFGFFSGIFITRILGPEGKGIYAKLFAGLEFGALMVGFNAVMGATYYSSNKKIKDKKNLGIGLLLSIISLFLLIIITIILYWMDGTFLLFPKGHFTPFIITYFFLGFILHQLKGYGQAMARGKKKFRSIFVFTILSSSLNLIVFSSLYFSGTKILEKDLYTVLTLNLLVSFTISAGWMLSIFKWIGFPSIQLSLKKHILPFIKYTFPAYTALIVNFITLKIDLWFIEYYLDAEELGFYSQAANVSQLILAVSIAMRYVVFPYLSKADKRENTQIMQIFSRLNLSLSLLIGSVAFFLAGILFPILYGSPFENSVLPFRILIIATLFLSFRSVFEVYNYAKNQARYNLVANSMAVISMIILDIILIPKYGIEGAAWSSVIAYSISTFFTFYSVTYVQGLPKRGYYLMNKTDFQKAKELINKRLR